MPSSSAPSPGVTVVETWDTLGMRPSQSHDTILDGVFVPDERIGRVTPAGDDADLFIIGMNMWALPVFASVYLGIAERALELAVASAHKKTSIAIPRGAYAYNPMVQHQIAEMYLELDAAQAHRRPLRGRLGGGRRPRAGVDRPSCSRPSGGPSKPPSAWSTSPSTSPAGAACSRATSSSGLYRDVRCGGFHPGNDAFTHEIVAKCVLGIAAEQPRW